MNVVKLVLFIGLLSASVVGEKMPEKKTDGVGIISPRSEAAESKDEMSSVTNDEEECNCTPFNLCKSFVATEDGGNRIDIR